MTHSNNDDFISIDNGDYGSISSRLLEIAGMVMAVANPKRISSNTIPEKSRMVSQSCDEKALYESNSIKIGEKSKYIFVKGHNII